MLRWAVVISILLLLSKLISSIFSFDFWLCLAGVTVVGYFVLNMVGKKYQNLIPTENANIQPAFDWPSVGHFDCEVVGESNYQAALKKLKGKVKDTRSLSPFKAFLIPENSNKYDKLAVRVDINGMTVGYLSKEDAREYRKLLKKKKISNLPTSCDAALTGGFVKNGGSLASIGVCLDIDIYGDNDDSDD